MRSRSLLKPLLFLFAAFAPALAGTAPAAEPPDVLFARAFTATPIDTFPAYAGITTVLNDPAGGVVTVGQFHGSVDFGGGSLVSGQWNGFGETVDVYAAKFDAAGNHVWSRVLMRGSNTGLPALSAAIDDGGNFVVVGAFSLTLDVGGTILNSSFFDAFAAKYGPDGSLAWGKRFGVTGPLGNMGYGVVIDADGNVVMTGFMTGRMDFGGGVLQSFGAQDVFLVKLDAAGEHVWSQRFGGAGSQQGRALAIDGVGNVYVAGSFTSTIDLGGGAFTMEGSFDDLFVAAFGPGGVHIRSQAIGTELAGIVSFAASASGETALTLFCNRSIVIGGQVVNHTGSILLRFDATGAYRWHFLLPSPSFTMDASFIGDESVVLAGNFRDIFDVGGTVFSSRGERDGFIARFDGDGATEWATQLGGVGHDGAASFAIRGDDDLWVTGGFGDGIELGETEFDGSGSFLANLGRRPPEPVMDVSLFRRDRAIEIRWSITSEQPLDALTVLRSQSNAPPSEAVYTGPIGMGVGSFIDDDVTAGRRYQYEIVVTSQAGGEYHSRQVSATLPVPSNNLAQNAPNPFNPRTTIEYSLQSRADVALEIYNATGTRVRRIDEGVRDAGEYAIEWDGRDDAGNVVGTGVYFYRLEGVAGVAPKKMVLLK